MPIPGLRRDKPYFTLILGSLLIGAAAPLCGLLNSELCAALMTASAWTLLPLASIFLPLHCCTRGCEKYLAFFPPVLCAYVGWLLLRLPMPVFSALLSLLLGILGSTIGAELYKRRLKKDKR